MTTKLRLVIAACSLLGLFSWASVSSTDPPAADRAGINTVLSEQQSAWNHGDIASFLRGYWHSPELTFSGSSGTTRGWNEVLARYQRQYPDAAAMGHLEFSDLEFRFLGPDAALVLGQWHLAREKDERGGVFTLVWRRFPEGWRIIHDHTSLVASQP
jgi:ketosteroid isomerase-like protein